MINPLAGKVLVEARQERLRQVAAAGPLVAVPALPRLRGRAGRALVALGQRIAGPLTDAPERRRPALVH
jgi:hypothetical protein